MSNHQAEPKIGAGHLDAMARQGLAELRAALYPESNVAQPPQYGMYGTPTPSEVSAARQTEVGERAEEPQGSVADRMNQIEMAEARQPEPPEPERG